MSNINLTYAQIYQAGGTVVEDQYGYVSVYMPNNLNVLAPVILNASSCLTIKPSYTWDFTKQGCQWNNELNFVQPNQEPQNCDVLYPIKLVLNPQGNDGTLFYVEENDNCKLKIEFDYLFKITCETIMNTSNGLNMSSIFESLDVSVTLDVVTTANTLETVFEYNLFPTIGAGNLYSYLSGNTNSGFYVCGDPSGNETSFSACTPLLLNTTSVNFIDSNVMACNQFMPYLVYELFNQSGLGAPMETNTTFNDAIKSNAFSSPWLTYSTEITDPDILKSIANKKIKLSIKINNSISDFCVLLDTLVLDKECTHIESSKIFLTQSPGFELDRIRDNKKSWIANTELTNRNFNITNNNGGNSIRGTNYDVNDERLIINSKEIDLDISLASAIETDVWCYINDNPCILTGITCGTKSFMDDNCFIFMDNIYYDFEDADENTGDGIPFNVLLTQPLSAITTVEDFEYFISSELTDVKDRQTLSGYPTLRALYDRYMNSTLYCNSESSKFTYLTMDQFAHLVGNYWVDIIEQVVPATTIWGSVKVYSNTIFDQQKFKYKAYTSLFNGNPYSGLTVSSPINGTSGFCNTVDVQTSVINISGITNTTVTNYTSICLAQMNSNSEFIGSVSIIGGTENNENVINEN